jgi:hypothetical protein
MILDEVLTSPELSEADRLVYALQMGNGEVTADVIAQDIAHGMPMNPRDVLFGWMYVLDDYLFLAGVVNA